MAWSFQCVKKPWETEWVDGPGTYHCPHCGNRHKAVETGAPDPEPGLPFCVNDHLKPHMDYACGQVINSKSQRRRIYESMGLQTSSMAERRRKHSTFPKPGTVVSYPGMKRRKSSAEGQQWD